MFIIHKCSFRNVFPFSLLIYRSRWSFQRFINLSLSQLKLKTNCVTSNSYPTKYDITWVPCKSPWSRDWYREGFTPFTAPNPYQQLSLLSFTCKHTFLSHFPLHSPDYSLFFSPLIYIGIMQGASTTSAFLLILPSLLFFSYFPNTANGDCWLIEGDKGYVWLAICSQNQPPYETIPQHINNTVHDLRLNENKLKAVLFSSMYRFTNLTDLNLTKNEINYIEDGAFAGQANLQVTRRQV